MKTLLIVAHGSRFAGSNQETAQLAGAVAGSLDAFDRVSHAFLELAEPDIPTAIGDLVDQGAEAITVLPLFLAQGSHVARDVPGIVAQARIDHPHTKLEIIPHIGTASGFIDLVATHARAGGALG